MSKPYAIACKWEFRLDSVAVIDGVKRTFEEILAETKERTGVGALAMTARVLRTGVLIPSKHIIIDPLKVEASLSSWLDPFPKPILLYHEKSRDAIGRVTAARYVRNETGNANLGAGWIELDFRVTDPDAIQRFLDKRYLTFSAGFGTEDVTCSACGGNPFLGTCKHRPGDVVLKKDPDGVDRQMIAIYTIGKHKANELSVVNNPADEQAMALHYDYITASSDDDGFTFSLSADADADPAGDLTFSFAVEPAGASTMDDTLDTLASALAARVEELFPTDVATPDALAAAAALDETKKLAIPNASYAAAAREVIAGASALSDEMRAALVAKLDEIAATFAAPGKEGEKPADGESAKAEESAALTAAEAKIAELDAKLAEAKSQITTLTGERDSAVAALSTAREPVERELAAAKRDMELFANAAGKTRRDAIAALAALVANAELVLMDERPAGADEEASFIAERTRELAGKTFRGICEQATFVAGTLRESVQPRTVPEKPAVRLSETSLQDNSQGFEPEYEDPVIARQRFLLGIE